MRNFCQLNFTFTRSRYHHLAKNLLIQSRSYSLLLIYLILFTKLHAQVSGGWNTNNTLGTTGYANRGNGVIELTDNAATGKVASSVSVTSPTYNPTTSDFNKCYKVFFGCPGSDNIGSDQGGDGMAFSFSTCSYTLVANSGGGGLGYMNVCPKMITIEFDTYSSQGNTGFDANYGGGTTGANDEISLHRDGDASDGGRISESNAGNLEDGLEHDVCISYNRTTHILLVKLDGVTKFSQDLTGSPYELGTYFGNVGLNQTWSAGKEGATNYMLVSDGTGIFSQIGGTPCPTPSCNKTSSVPTIDATKEVLWNSYPSTTLTHFSVGTPVANLSANYRLMYDNTNLYVFVDVTDNVRNSNDNVNYWQNDGVEIYIDINNDKSAAYGADDYQYALVLNTVSATIGTTGMETKHSPASITGVVFAQANNASGYTMEFKFPWNTLKAGYTPVTGTYLGFDISINDNDGGSRVNQLSWTDGTFSEWGNPGKFGNVLFSSCDPLPVDLVNFTGEMKDGKGILNWITSLEKNNKTFIIERSKDSHDWESIGEVSGAGDLSSLSNYKFIDNSPFQHVTYYRLKQIDFNGAYMLSDVIAIKSNLANLNLSPNPFDQSFNIHTNVNGILNIQIHDMLGRLLVNADQNVIEGLVNLQPDLDSGVYMITIKSETFVIQRKIVKK
jgi:hypothetical protein